MSMTSRHAAALALVGWYLLTPKIRNPKTYTFTGQAIVGDHLTLSQWGINSAFDNAKDCEMARGKMWKDSREMRQKFETEAGREVLAERPDHGAEVKGIAESYRDALCVASDDPRLKEK
jgi:hypothetical protein